MAEQKVVELELMKSEEIQKLQKEIDELHRSQWSATVNEYEVKEKVGQGEFGKCFKAVHKATGEVRCFKIIDISQMQGRKRELSLQEADLLSKLDHPNIVKLYHWEKSVDSDEILLILEFCPDGELNDLVDKRIAMDHPLTDEEIFHYTDQIARGILYCHQLQPKIIHRDLKVQNILLDPRGDVKISDFGVATSFESVHLVNEYSKQFGTLAYCAPERIDGEAYTELSDVWSFGVILYILATLKRPFDGIRSIQYMRYDMVALRGVNPVFRRIIHDIFVW